MSKDKFLSEIMSIIKQGVTRKEIAEHSNITETTVQNYVNGTSSAYTKKTMNGILTSAKYIGKNRAIKLLETCN